MATGTDNRYAWDIYAEHLLPRGHGHPLWMPDHDSSKGEIQLCDVGWIERGEFFPLFNAICGEANRQIKGVVPAGFKPLDRSTLWISGPQEDIQQRCIHGRTIKDFCVSLDVSVGGYV